VKGIRFFFSSLIRNHLSIPFTSKILSPNRTVLPKNAGLLRMSFSLNFAHTFFFPISPLLRIVVAALSRFIRFRPSHAYIPTYALKSLSVSLFRDTVLRGVLFFGNGRRDKRRRRNMRMEVSDRYVCVFRSSGILNQKGDKA
jgi:hypothetical protein